MNILDLINKCKIIGLGEFSHGINESWKLRFDMLKEAMRKTNKKIIIFNEFSDWMADNIMNNTYFYKDKSGKWKKGKYNSIKIENSHDNSPNPSFGKYWQYMHHGAESKLFLQIIKYIRKHKDRIRIYGFDEEKYGLARDYPMYREICKKYNPKAIHFLWMHNSHIDDRKLDMINYKYTKKEHPNWKHYCGHYLKKKFGKKYCILLTQAYKGKHRFNGYCIGKNCEKRIYQLKYIYKSFINKKAKKYVNKKKPIQWFKKYDAPFMEFSNSYFTSNKYGSYKLKKYNKYDYIVFFNKVTPPKTLCEY